MTWSQNYLPTGHLFTSVAVAILPVLVLLGLLAFWHVKAHLAALAGLATALAIAMLVLKMPPPLALTAMAYGAAFGLFPIGWIVLNAIFVYNLSVSTGGFAVIQQQVTTLSRDLRIQALLIAFSFGAMIEGAAGFGAPVAISGALLIGLGFKPLEAAKLALIGNTAPVAFGGLGIPLVTLAAVTGLDLQSLSAMVGRQLPIFSLIVPFWLIVVQSGWRGLRGAWPACLVVGGTFSLMQFLVSNFVGPMLVDIAAAATSMAALVIFTRFWRPADESEHTLQAAAKAVAPAAPSARERWRAWAPWLILVGCVYCWSLPVVRKLCDECFAPSFYVPLLHRAVLKVPPAVVHAEPESAVYALNLLSATGSALLIAGVIGGCVLGLRPAALAQLYWKTFRSLRIALLTIALMLALGFTTRYSGTDTIMGLALASTGWLFPLCSPLIGWLGVALTGSDTSSNVLFGNLQQVTAHQLGLSPVMMAAANSSGGVMGKMIDAQSIVVAGVATSGHKDSPHPGTILRAVFWHSLSLALLVGVLVMIQAHWIKG